MTSNLVLSQLTSLASTLNIDVTNATEIVSTLKATAFKTKDAISDAQLSALLIVANQYKLNPWTKEIYAYPDKGGIVPVVSVDGWTRIADSRPQYDGFEFVYSSETSTHKGKLVHQWIECKVFRKDRSHPAVVREYFDEVKRDLTYANPWESHPKRMHRHKTYIQALRLAFGFSGIYDEDEAARIVDINEYPEKQDSIPNTAKFNTVNAETVEVNSSDSLPTYSQSDFDKNFPKWSQMIISGKKTALDLIAFLSTKASLSDDQQEALLNVGVSTIVKDDSK